MGIALGFILALHLLGLGLKRSGARSLRPAVFTSTLVAIPMLFWVNMDFYDLHRVSADATGLTIERYMGPDDRIAWAEVRALEVLDGAPFPVMTDDRSLRVVGAQGASCVLPRYVPEVDAIVALGLKHIQAASTLPKEATP